MNTFFARITLVLVAVFVVGCAEIRTPVGQAPQAVSEAVRKVHPYEFAQKEQCVSAMANGDFSFYTPVETKGKGKVPESCKKLGETTKTAKAETPLCVQTLTPSGKKFVVVDRGTPLFWRGKKGEDPQPCGLVDCGNPIFDIAFPEPALVSPKPEPVPSPAPSSKQETARAPEGCFYDARGQQMCKTETPSMLEVFACGGFGALAGGPPGALASLVGGGIGWLIDGKNGAVWGCTLAGVGAWYAKGKAAQAAASAASPPPASPPVQGPVSPPL